MSQQLTMEGNTYDQSTRRSVYDDLTWSINEYTLYCDKRKIHNEVVKSLLTKAKDLFEKLDKDSKNEVCYYYFMVREKLLNMGIIYSCDEYRLSIENIHNKNENEYLTCIYLISDYLLYYKLDKYKLFQHEDMEYYLVKARRFFEKLDQLLKDQLSSLFITQRTNLLEHKIIHSIDNHRLSTEIYDDPYDYD
jgi:hypothetical protein